MTFSRSPFGDAGVARAVIGGALYLTVTGVFALALGTIVRYTVGGIAAYAAILFVIPPITNVLPSGWNEAISPYLPSNADRDVFSLVPDPHALDPWTGLALFCGYTIVALGIAAVLLMRSAALAVE